MTFQSDDRAFSTCLAHGAAIGVDGGLAEVLVVAAYAGMTGADGAAVATAVATAVRIDPGSAAAGLAVHMALAASLGVVLLALANASGWLRGASATRSYALGLLALGAVWALNFFVVLPVVSPGFVHLLPYALTLASKLMFGVAAVASLRTLVPGGAARRSPARLDGLDVCNTKTA